MVTPAAMSCEATQSWLQLDVTSMEAKVMARPFHKAKVEADAESRPSWLAVKQPTTFHLRSIISSSSLV